MTANRRESEWKSESEMYKSMCSQLKVQLSTQETLLRDAQKRQAEVRKDFDLQLKEEARRHRDVEDRLIRG